MTKKEERKEVGEEREANKIVVGRWDTREMNEKVGVPYRSVCETLGINAGSRYTASRFGCCTAVLPTY
jgi:hypothetical protein